MGLTNSVERLECPICHGHYYSHRSRTGEYWRSSLTQSWRYVLSKSTLAHYETFEDHDPLLTHYCKVGGRTSKYGHQHEKFFADPYYDRRPQNLNRPKQYRVENYEPYVDYGFFNTLEEAELIKDTDIKITPYTIIERGDDINYYPDVMGNVLRLMFFGA